MAKQELDTDTQCATYLKAVADPLRIRIIRALQHGPLSVSDLVELTEQEINVVSHHLRVLYHAGLVATRREGKFIYYSLSEDLFAAKRSKSGLLDLGCCRLEIDRGDSTGALR